MWPVTHYFDVKRICRDCNKPYLFFAQEQKHWYEELGFSIEANCVRCVFCRKHHQQLARFKRRYGELVHTENRSVEQSIEMAECCLSLLEEGIFHQRAKEKVRMLLNRIPEERGVEIRARLLELEASAEESGSVTR